MYKKEAANSERVLSPKDLSITKDMVEYLKARYKTDLDGVLEIIKGSINSSIPANIFIKELSPFETIVKFLFENRKISLNDIAKMTARTKQNIYTTYRKANRKHAEKLGEKTSKYHIPVSILAKEAPVLECITEYLRAGLGLSFHEISRLLKRKYGTIWTVNNRSRKRNEK